MAPGDKKMQRHADQKSKSQSGFISANKRIRFPDKFITYLHRLTYSLIYITYLNFQPCRALFNFWGRDTRFRKGRSIIFLPTTNTLAYSTRASFSQNYKAQLSLNALFFK
jgi:hypothetical protein